MAARRIVLAVLGALAGLTVVAFPLLITGYYGLWGLHDSEAAANVYLVAVTAGAVVGAVLLVRQGER
ncbi:MAG: hypothetical protein R8F63_08070 [Acidimicrobiales bacterium]|nr:hypothetical protein [Acidimicrobiales bacterium]